MPFDMAPAAFGRWVSRLVEESLRRSGRTTLPTEAEIAAHRGLLAANTLRIAHLEIFASYLAPGARLTRVAPLARGDDAFAMPDALSDLLAHAAAGRTSADELSRLFRLLAPFTEANNRIARALWLWRTIRDPDVGADDLASLTFPAEPVFERTAHRENPLQRRAR